MQHCKVNTDIEVAEFLPSARVVGHRTQVSRANQAAIEVIGACGGYGRKVVVVAEAAHGTTGNAVADTKFQVVEPLGILFDERLFRDSPTGTGSAEVAPAIVGMELGSAVTTTEKFNEVLAGVIVVQTGDVRHITILVRTARDGLVGSFRRSRCQVEQAFIEQP